MALQIITGPTIAAGATLSGPINITSPNVSLAQIYFPAAWSASPPLTFQASPDGGKYYDVYRVDGQLLQLRVVPGGMVNVETTIWRAAFFKFRSGTPPNGAVQHESRTFICILDSGAS